MVLWHAMMTSLNSHGKGIYNLSQPIVIGGGVDQVV